MGRLVLIKHDSTRECIVWTVIFLSIVLNPSLGSSATKEQYEKRIGQQLDQLTLKIDGLRSKRHTLKGPARVRLTANIRMLQAKLGQARALWREIRRSTSGEWLMLKRELDAKVIRLNKSYNQVANTLLED
jgi:hypothetical protein